MPWNTFHKESRHAINKKLQQLKTEKKLMFPAGLEPATFRVWGGRDNHYTTETHTLSGGYNVYLPLSDCIGLFQWPLPLFIVLRISKQWWYNFKRFYIEGPSWCILSRSSIRWWHYRCGNTWCHPNSSYHWSTILIKRRKRQKSALRQVLKNYAEVIRTNATS